MTTETADRTWSDKALAFIGRELTLPDGTRLGSILHRDPWITEDILKPIFAQRADGLPLHRSIWIEAPRGYAKTFMIAAAATAEALGQPYTEVYAVASDVEQARLLIAAIRAQCERNPRLAAAFKMTRDTFSVPSNHSLIRGSTPRTMP